MALASGLVLPIMFIGFISQLSLPLVIMPGLAFAFFIWKVFQKHKLGTLVANTIT